MEAYWNRKTFVLVTGASRGIGRCIAIEFSKKVGPNSIFLLLARSLQGLEDTRNVMLQNRGDITVSVAAVDLGKPNASEYTRLIMSAIKGGINKSSFEHVMIVQNAASLGIKSGLKIAEMDDLAEVRDYYSFNLDSFILLNSAFFKVFSESEDQQQNQIQSVVHISSDGALEPFKTWGLYCAAKSARDMILKSMALESGIHALNWAPGCVNTDIYTEAINLTADPELKKFFEESKNAGNILSCEQTVTKLMRVLAGQQFIKGEHVSYHQIPDV